jgi:peroxiredoxin
MPFIVLPSGSMRKPGLTRPWVTFRRNELLFGPLWVYWYALRLLAMNILRRSLVAALFAFAASASFAADDLTTQFSALVKETQAKLQAGARTAEALAPELKRFDELLAANAANRTDEVAQIQFALATLYAGVVGDFDRATSLLLKLKTDFPDTKYAARVDQTLAVLENQRAQMAARLEHERTYAPGKVFPDFAETDLDGKPLSIAKYKGKVVLLDFWATWCGPCIAELPNVVAAYKKYHDKGFEIIGISLDRPDSLQKLKDFAKEHEMPWAQFYDGKYWANKLAVRYQIQSIPATFLLDGEGKIIARDLRGPALERAVAKALGL